MDLETQFFKLQRNYNDLLTEKDNQVAEASKTSLEQQIEDAYDQLVRFAQEHYEYEGLLPRISDDEAYEDLTLSGELEGYRHLNE